MSITKITDPSSLPLTTADYQNQNVQIEKLLGNVNQPYPVIGGNIVKGSLFNIGGDMFYCGADTAISGTASDYVKLVVSGATATPEYVASLSGVAWEQAYNGYYNGSDLYVFDEAKALVDGELSALSSKLGRLFEIWIGQSLKTTASPTFANATINNDLTVNEDLTIDGTAMIKGGRRTYNFYFYSTYPAQLFLWLFALVPNTGDDIIVNVLMRDKTNSIEYIFNRLRNTGSTTSVKLYCLEIGSGLKSLTIQNTGTTPSYGVSFAY